MRAKINVLNLKNNVNISFMDGPRQTGVLYFPQIVPVNHYSMDQMIVGLEAEIMVFTLMNTNQVHYKLLFHDSIGYFLIYL